MRSCRALFVGSPSSAAGKAAEGIRAAGPGVRPMLVESRRDFVQALARFKPDEARTAAGYLKAGAADYLPGEGLPLLA